MTKKDILELKRRLKKEDCTFTRMSGCYVDGQKNILLRFNQSFLNLPEEEFHKYLELAKKLLSGAIGNNLLPLSFLEEEEAQGKQQFFLGLRDSKLKNDDLLLRLYELVIEHYEYTGNYLILLFHDAYDVIVKTKDNQTLDESDEVYEYLMCAICPVTLTKAGLGYREEENKFGARVRDWIVAPPETGFLFPAFSDRSSDIHSVIYYTKNSKEPRPEFMDAALGCKGKRTATEERDTFQSIVKHALQNEEIEDGQEVFLEIQQNLNHFVEERISIYEKEPVVLDHSTIQDILLQSGVPDAVAKTIEKTCAEEFGDALPEAKNVIDTKALTAHAQKKKELTLQKQVQALTQKLEETKMEPLPSPIADGASPVLKQEEVSASFDHKEIILHVRPEKLPQIKSQLIDGQKCIIIPIEEEEQATINGVHTEI